MNKLYRILWSIIVCILCSSTSASNTIIEKIFFHPYLDNDNQRRSISFFKASPGEGCGPIYILVANELWNQDHLDLKKLLTSKEDGDVGIIKAILLDAHPLPAFRSSYQGIPVVIEWGLNTKSECLWLIIGNYGEYIRIFTFFKDRHGVFSVQNESKWPSSFIENPTVKYKLLWNEQVAFLCQTENPSTEFLKGIRLLLNGPADPITPLMPFLYPYCPSEIAFLSSDSDRFESDTCFRMPSNFIGVKINDKLLNATKIEEYASRYLYSTGMKAYSINELVFSAVMANLMENMFLVNSEFIFPEFNIIEDIKLFCVNNKLSISENIDVHKLNINNISFKYAVSEFVEKNKMECPNVTEEESQKLFEQFKNIFRKKFEQNSELSNFSEIRDYVEQQVMRLKYYGMGKLLDMQLKIDLVWQESKSIGEARGLLDPPLPEEAERLKEEFLASQPLKVLFSTTELEELLSEPDYTKILDPLQLAQAYDWAGKYPEALATLENAVGLEAKFEQGRFLKYGRPGISADEKRANELFSEVVSTIEIQGEASSPANDCLAGRACREYVPENWTDNVSWRKRAAKYFQKAIRQGYRPAYYYSQYYERHSSDNNPEELLNALPSDNLEIRGFIAGLAAMNPRFKELRNRERNLAAIKEAIHAHSNVVQCILGMLYLVSDANPNALLVPNLEKAQFWLQRAADRGDEDAAQILQSDSRFRSGGSEPK